MNKTTFIFLILISTYYPNTFAQNIKLDKKALSFLASEEKINIEFTYDGLLFNEDSIPEQVYLNEIAVKVRETQGEEGVEDWMGKFNSSKNEHWPDIFTETLNQKMNEYKNGPQFEIDASDATYTMRVNTK
jgi:hypothetical protein